MENQKTLSEVLTRHLRTSARRKKFEEKHYASNVELFVDQSEEINAEKAIEQWANENNVNLFVITPIGFQIALNAKRITRECPLGGSISTEVIAPTSEQIDILNRPNTVLFFKNIHQMQNKKYRRYLLDLVNGDDINGLVADDREPSGYKILNGLMFAIATHSKTLDLELFCADAKDTFAQYTYNEFEKEKIEMAKYPLFKDVFDTVKAQSKLKGIEWYDEIRDMADEIAKVKAKANNTCENGSRDLISNPTSGAYSLELHIKRLICAMLTAQTVFDLHLSSCIADGSIDDIFTNPSNGKAYDAEYVKNISQNSPDVFINAIKAIHCGNRLINLQMRGLYRCVQNLEAMYKLNAYDIKNGYYTGTHTNGVPDLAKTLEIVKNLAELNGKYKMIGMGVPLVCEYLKSFGINIVKPDTHVCRIIARLGYRSTDPEKNKNAMSKVKTPVNVYDTILVCDDIAKEYTAVLSAELLQAGIVLDPAIAVDTILWQFGAEKKLEFCGEKKPPRCNDCNAKNGCPWHKKYS